MRVTPNSLAPLRQDVVPTTRRTDLRPGTSGGDPRRASEQGAQGAHDATNGQGAIPVWLGKDQRVPRLTAVNDTGDGLTGGESWRARRAAAYYAETAALEQRQHIADVLGIDAYA